MALTRKFLKGLGLTDDQTESIIEAHTDVTERMKAENDALKKESGEHEKLKEEYKKAQDSLKEFDKIKNDLEIEKTAHSEFKKQVEAQQKKAQQDKAYKKWLMDLGHSSDSADKIMRIDSRRPKFNDKNEIDDSDGSFKKDIDADWHVEPNKSWSEGAKTSTPPASNGNGGGVSRARQLAQEYHVAKYGGTVSTNKEE